MLTTCTLNKINWCCSIFFGAVLAEKQLSFPVEEKERTAASRYTFCTSTDPFIPHSSLPLFPTFLGSHISASVRLCFEDFQKQSFSLDDKSGSEADQKFPKEYTNMAVLGITPEITSLLVVVHQKSSLSWLTTQFLLFMWIFFSRSKFSYSFYLEKIF